MYIIIICATLPTLRQSYSVVLNHSRKTSAYTHTQSTPRQRPIPLRHRSLDASLFATQTERPPAGAGSRHSSQEYILDAGIHKTTEVHVVQEDPAEGLRNPHFPQPDPFRRQD